MSINKFPPKFSQKILYPAIYNLDEYPMPQESPYGDSNPGDYFSTSFPPYYNLNNISTLSYGKHNFKCAQTGKIDDAAYG